MTVRRHGARLRLFVTISLLLSASLARAAPFQRGVSLGLFHEDALWSYEGLLKEIKDLGASHVGLVVAYYQEHAGSTQITSHPRFTAPDEALTRTIRQAHALGLKVMVFPIIRLSHPRTANEWRGTLAPRDPAAWWRSYEALLLRLARLCAREKVELLSVGSELGTLDVDPRPWEGLIRKVRARYRGPLTYSGNWDHYDKVGIYPLVDLAGLCAYFGLVDGAAQPPFSVDALTASWRGLKRTLEAFAGRIGRPLLFTEVGYLSQRGAAAWPWKEAAKGEVDLEEQRRCYEAFTTTWQESPHLAGVYFWNWYGWGGKASSGYTPRGKPAAEVVRRYFTER